MPISTRSTSAMPSWPAPDGSRRTGRPSASIALPICCCSQGAQEAVLPSCVGRMSTFTLRRAQIDAIASLDVGRGAPALLVRRCAEVDREPDLAGNHVGRPRRRLEPSHGADELRLAPAARFDREHAFGRRGERVAPQRHRHGSRMPGHAFDLDEKAVGAVDGGDHADRQAFRLEHRALLDVQARRRRGFPPAAARRRRRARDRGRTPSAPRASTFHPCRGFRAACASKVPAIARLPSSVEPKRTPSSSAKPTTSIANGRRVPRALSVWTQSIAATTPSMPSYLPALRTVSRWEPSMRQGAPAFSTFVAADHVADRIEPGAHARFAHPAERQARRRRAVRGTGRSG